MKKIITAMATAALVLTVLIPSAHAGSPQSHRWEGIAIGVGAAILGSALMDNHYRTPAPAPRVTAPPTPRYGRHRGFHGPRHRVSGHWEIRKTWVPPVYEKVWNPGYFNRRGHWVRGEWIRLEREPGYWEKERVWVARR